MVNRVRFLHAEAKDEKAESSEKEGCEYREEQES